QTTAELRLLIDFTHHCTTCRLRSLNSRLDEQAVNEIGARFRVTRGAQRLAPRAKTETFGRPGDAAKDRGWCHWDAMDRTPALVAERHEELVRDVRRGVRTHHDRPAARRGAADENSERWLSKVH